MLNGENHRFDPNGVQNDGLTQRIGGNGVLKSNVITNEERIERQRKWMGFQKMCGCVWEKK